MVIIVNVACPDWAKPLCRHTKQILFKPVCCNKPCIVEQTGSHTHTHTQTVVLIKGVQWRWSKGVFITGNIQMQPLFCSNIVTWSDWLDWLLQDQPRAPPSSPLYHSHSHTHTHTHTAYNHSLTHSLRCSDLVALPPNYSLPCHVSPCFSHSRLVPLSLFPLTQTLKQ